MQQSGRDVAVTTGFEPGAIIAGRHLMPELMQTLRDAAAKTGVDFDFLVAQASVESGFRSKARAARSSAAGIFQFTGSTWLQMMREHGAKYGYADLAAAVKPAANGTVGVADKATQQRILALRQDDRLSALFAAEYAKSNAARLENATGHRATAAELHLAHLLGPNGAVRFLKAHEDDERQAAAKILPAAARHNPALFYGRGGRTAKSVAAVYQKIQEKLDLPLRQVAELETDQLRPALGLSDRLPRTPTDRRA
jgi:transglycosylase-like protein with SLT domain